MAGVESSDVGTFTTINVSVYDNTETGRPFKDTNGGAVPKLVPVIVSWCVLNDSVAEIMVGPLPAVSNNCAAIESATTAINRYCDAWKITKILLCLAYSEAFESRLSMKLCGTQYW